MATVIDLAQTTSRSLRTRCVRGIIVAVTAVAASALVPRSSESASALPAGQTDAPPSARPTPPTASSRLARPPAAPHAYRLPRRAIWVSNPAQLRRALSRYTARDIIL